MLRIAIVEDDPAHANKLCLFLERYQQEQKIELTFTVFPDGMAIVQDYHSEWDIIFLDIEMPYLDGMSAAKEIRAKDETVVLIFITNMAHYAINGYEVEALGFMLKPITYDQFYMKMQKAVSVAKLHEQKYVLITTREELIRLPADEILYVEVINHHLHIHTLTDENEIVVFDSLKNFELCLPAKGFVRCGQSYIVNLRHVKKVMLTSVLVDRYEIPVSRMRRKEFLKIVSDYIGGGGQ